ncbi:MAG TPA: MBL fold metallo-hydrolase [Bacillota bacterium]|nr:MBL fold metallo-hydrolase [Bacillota bacterium]HPT88609.1 MBL fold metallo-hydrolase [Bacillota bacterium]
MKLKLTYVFHNCFMITIENTVFLFDYPEARFLSETMEQIVLNEIAGRRLYYFVSHSHADHFNPDPSKIIQAAQDRVFILSEDTYAEAANYHGNIHYFLPDECRTIDGMEITTFESSDEGVAFLIRFNEKLIYFGGDLANWNWDELEIEEKQAMESFYTRFLDRLSAYVIDVAMVNTDPRMNTWAGAAEFIEKIKPKFFVPMHTFGKTATLKRFYRSLAPEHPPVFLYQEPGDSMEIEI